MRVGHRYWLPGKVVVARNIDRSAGFQVQQVGVTLLLPLYWLCVILRTLTRDSLVTRASSLSDVTANLPGTRSQMIITHVCSFRYSLRVSLQCWRLFR